MEVKFQKINVEPLRLEILARILYDLLAFEDPFFQRSISEVKLDPGNANPLTLALHSKAEVTCVIRLLLDLS
ncbi:hypothetical protein CRP01_27870 [Flavilitoribacter nigricans DSM 23189 = NBRC 102662]|uniref:Uncharacterized protein n=1 Tax=Flavilitoribacter nigricans (strain ATCC 23147 / DSM 23189 / NBRC 102662 / NCIMB 1420 / SS-2) TaxID=1122177 RepID=A0A2D0N3Y6_FLAN2|nr:hypothetical protein CRP01_27870 [Flavilitoribacter nigricans DSM 23189 = NBRC 102662]